MVAFLYVKQMDAYFERDQTLRDTLVRYANESDDYFEYYVTSLAYAELRRMDKFDGKLMAEHTVEYAESELQKDLTNRSPDDLAEFWKGSREISALEVLAYRIIDGSATDKDRKDFTIAYQKYTLQAIQENRKWLIKMLSH